MVRPTQRQMLKQKQAQMLTLMLMLTRTRRHDSPATLQAY